MKVRVRPRSSINYAWKVEAFHPEQKRWCVISIHSFHWFANLKAKVLSHRSTKVMQPKKEKFIEKLNGTDET